MPRTGIGAVPWSIALSSDQLVELAETGKVEFVTAHMKLAADAEPPLIGIGALIRDPDNYPHSRMIIVVDSESRGQGLGKRIADELLRQLRAGETVQVEVQEAFTTQRRRARFFEIPGFKCVEEKYRTGDVPEFARVRGRLTRRHLAEKYCFICVYQEHRQLAVNRPPGLAIQAGVKDCSKTHHAEYFSCIGFGAFTFP